MSDYIYKSNGEIDWEQMYYKRLKTHATIYAEDYEKMRNFYLSKIEELDKRHWLIDMIRVRHSFDMSSYADLASQKMALQRELNELRTVKKKNRFNIIDKPPEVGYE